jgi:hypothetical protein
MTYNQGVIELVSKYSKYGNEYYCSKNDIFVLNQTSVEIYSYTIQSLKNSVREKRHNDYMFRFRNINQVCVNKGFVVKEDNARQIITDDIKSSDVQIKLKKLTEIANQYQSDSMFIDNDIIQRIKLSIKKFNLTHIEFKSNEHHKLLLHGFDIRRFCKEDFTDFAFCELEVPYNFTKTFSIRSQVFEKLPINDYDLMLFKDDYVCFVNEEKRVEMFVKTQEIGLPVLQASQTHLQTSLLLHPKLSSA